MPADDMISYQRILLGGGRMMAVVAHRWFTGAKYERRRGGESVARTVAWMEDIPISDSIQICRECEGGGCI